MELSRKAPTKYERRAPIASYHVVEAHANVLTPKAYAFLSTAW